MELKNIPKVTSAVQGRRLLIRGTKEWDDREDERLGVGHTCMSFGTVLASIETNGRSSLTRRI